MKFSVLNKEKQAVLSVEEKAYTGVKKILHKIAGDLRLVTGKTYTVNEVSFAGEEKEVQQNTSSRECMGDDVSVVLAATIGSSDILDCLEAESQIDLNKIRGKWECYLFQLVSVTESMKQKIPGLAGISELLLIAGSDKRGTIYGMFHLSELIGVSPWVYWADVMPRKKNHIVFTENDNFISKEPSVKYRGFFINDEWPSFGNWTMEHFNGFTTEMYDHVFELLLRLKGNYLWPAMWSSSFSLDGPGLSSAELADEYGIVMCNSHHEPCLRHSEEWDLVRGEDSIYGNAWNFDRNRDGLIQYWRDGLKRNGAFENIITMGMRGERDSKILGHDAGLADNINYLKDVITTQNQLIREVINEDLTQVPRMLALYKEVEAYYYGDKDTKGLEGWDELDGITLMLCEDNFGNMRTLPDPETRNRNGGWGMYYHFDYHGEPVSYEWVNSTHLQKVWEQMGMAFEMGVRNIWVVNVGDLKPQELPLSFFMDLAYDFDTWGNQGCSQPEVYTRKWIAEQFSADFSEEELHNLYQVIDGYTKQNSIRKPEALQPNTYHPVHYDEADRILEKVEKLESITKKLEEKAKSLQSLEDGQMRYSAFYELVYFPVMASMNLLKMQIYAGKNALYAKQGRISANYYADCVTKCIEEDRRLQAAYHATADGKWNGIMSSEHIGFMNWNDEGCQYPIRSYIEPANKVSMIVAPSDDTTFTTGGEWTRKTLTIRKFMDPYETEASLDIANCSKIPFTYTTSCDVSWLQLSEPEGEVQDTKKLRIILDRNALNEVAAEGEVLTAHICIDTSFAHVDVDVMAVSIPKEADGKPYVSACGAAVEASDYIVKKDTEKGGYQSVPNLGKYPTAEKVFPVTESYIPGEDAPSLTYEFYLPKSGNYVVTCLSTPANPISSDNQLRFGFRWENEAIRIIDTVDASYCSGEVSCKQWAEGVLDQVHETTVIVEGKKGINRLTIYACDAAYVLERILIMPEENEWKESYMGLPVKRYSVSADDSLQN